MPAIKSFCPFIWLEKKYVFLFVAVFSFVTIWILFRNYKFSITDYGEIKSKQPTKSPNDYDELWDWPSIRGTSITQEEIKDKLKRCKIVAIQRNHLCKDVHAKPQMYWKPYSANVAEDVRRLNLATRCCAFDDIKLMMPAPQLELYPWEKDILSKPAMKNIDDIASAIHSFVVLVNETNNFKLGDIVNFKVTLLNGKGGRIKEGGNKVRIWLVTKSLKAAIAADVQDNNDGTYSASCPLNWIGTLSVKATISHHRELFRTTLFLQRLFTTTHWEAGVFTNGSISEITICSPVPKLPGYNISEMCNLTDVNEFKWFCGKPRFVDCITWKSTIRLLPSMNPMTEAEEILNNQTETKRPFMIPCNITLTVFSRENYTVVPSQMISCSKRNLSETFEDLNASGFFYNGLWQTTKCKLPIVDKNFLLECLNKTQVYVVGDSNSREQFFLFKNFTACNDLTHATKKSWHSPMRCEIKSVGAFINYYPHKLPFYGSSSEYVTNDALFSAVNLMDNIPKDGKFLIHLHHFLHVMPYHLSVAEHHLRLIRDAIQRLLKRNPTALVVYQTVHTAYYRQPDNCHKLSVFLLELQKRYLRDLGERVMLAQTWPMTIAAENSAHHPIISDQFFKFYMGHICSRF